ncbi:unnamed protein product, partial [Amoebophrya sp. A25]
VDGGGRYSYCESTKTAAAGAHYTGVGGTTSSLESFDDLLRLLVPPEELVCLCLHSDAAREDPAFRLRLAKEFFPIF